MMLLPPCRLRQAAALCTVLLMVGITVAANFGWFNLLTAALCLPLLPSVQPPERDGAATTPISCPPQGGVSVTRRRVQRVVLRLLLAWHAVCTFVLLLPSERISPQILWWEPLDRLATANASPAAVSAGHKACHQVASATVWMLRVLTGWRLAHSYGVIPPEAATTPHKMVTLFEVSWQGGPTSTLPLRYMPWHKGATVPWCVAPWMPRFEFFRWYMPGYMEELLPPLAAAHARSSDAFELSVAYALMRPPPHGHGRPLAAALFNVHNESVWPPERGAASSVRIRYVYVSPPWSREPGSHAATAYPSTGGDATAGDTLWIHEHSSFYEVDASERPLNELPAPYEGGWRIHAPGLLALSSASRDPCPVGQVKSAEPGSPLQHEDMSARLWCDGHRDEERQWRSGGEALDPPPGLVRVLVRQARVVLAAEEALSPSFVSRASFEGAVRVLQPLWRFRSRSARPEAPMTVGGAARFEVPAMPCAWSDHFLPSSYVQADACAVLELAKKRGVANVGSNGWWGMLVEAAWQLLDAEQQQQQRSPPLTMVVGEDHVAASKSYSCMPWCVDEPCRLLTGEAASIREECGGCHATLFGCWPGAVDFPRS